MRNSASRAPAKFDGLHGLCVAFNKILVCDTNNARIQVFDAKTEDRFYWGKLLRIIPARQPRGFPRFDLPRDVDVSNQGDIYVLDIGRREVAVLNSRFERLGSFGQGVLSMPWALDLSDDGRHCYVTDLQGNQVHHFVRQD